MQAIGDLMPYASMDKLNRINQQIKRQNISKWNITLSFNIAFESNNQNHEFCI